MKTFSTLAVVLMIIPISQGHGRSGDRPLQSLVDSEKAFAAMAEERGIREAFLTFLADDAIIFRPAPVSGRKTYEEVPADSPFLLTWTPAFAEVSGSGDLGYTTGPYELRDRSRPDQPSRYGHYVSVWEKRETGQWKVVFDAGIGHAESGSRPDDVATRPSDVQLWQGVRIDRPQGEKALIDLENDFAEKAAHQGMEGAYLYFADGDIRSYRENSFPHIGKDAVLKNASKTSRKIEWNPMKGALSTSGDIGYAYGICAAAGDEGEPPQPESWSYLRIWRRAADGRWSVVLDLMVPVPQPE